MAAGSNSTKEAIKYAKNAEKEGADAILTVAPYYNKPSQDGLKAHFGAIAQAVNIPVILYKKPKKITSKEEIDLAYKISKVIDVDYSKLDKINLKEFWIEQNKTLANKKITDEEWNKLKNRKLIFLIVILCGSIIY